MSEESMSLWRQFRNIALATPLVVERGIWQLGLGAARINGPLDNVVACKRGLIDCEKRLGERLLR